MTATLILGGARSGKSRIAEEKAAKLSLKRTYIATATAGDDEMTARIQRHQKDRDHTWVTVECPLQLSEALVEHALEGNVVLVDCLTLWLSNLMHHQRNIEQETVSLCDALAVVPGSVVMVSNEVGMGLVPNTPLGREFRDQQGWLNQSMAKVCQRVEFVAAGLPLVLKADG